MNITACPNCGGLVRSESIGWKCESCRGFIDMQGNFHEHIDRPFMPPPTYADRIRSMSDEELTAAIYQLIYAKDPALWFCKGSKECGELIDNNQDIPAEMCKKCLLKKLRQPAEEGAP